MSEAIKTEGVTLANVADGELENQFQETLADVVTAFAEAPIYEHSSGEMKCSVVCEVVFKRHAETGVVTVATRAAFKPPKRKPAVRGAFVRDGVVLVEQAKQVEAPGILRPLKAENGGESK